MINKQKILVHALWISFVSIFIVRIYSWIFNVNVDLAVFCIVIVLTISLVWLINTLK